MIKVIILDYFGVFTRPGTFTKVIHEYSEKYGLDEEKFRKLRRELWDKARVEEISEGEFWKRLVKGMKIPVPLEKMRVEWYNYFEPVRETFNLVTRLKKRYRVVLITNTLREWFGFWKDRFSLDEVFDVILTSFEEKVAKNGKEIYLVALRRLKVKPEECVFVDDKEENLETARKLGMNVILFKNPGQLERELKKLSLEF